MNRLILNEDPNHFCYTRSVAGMNDVSRQYAEDFINQYDGLGLTDIMICLGASSPWYFSKRIPGIVDKYDRWVADGRMPSEDAVGDDVLSRVARSVAIYKNFYRREGVNIQQVWIDRARALGIKPWISIRMNDIHNASEKGSFLQSEFFEAHPEYGRAAHRTPSGYFDYALDFTNPEVRAHYLQVIRDALEVFDADGIELDWMREIYCAGIGREEEAVEILTDFHAQIYSIVKEAEKARGHEIPIAVRMPHSIEKALRLGFDIITLVRRGYINLITVTPRWSSTDNNLPIDVWKRVFDGTGVPIIAGLEILYDSENYPRRRYKYMTEETVCGSCEAYYAMGADGIYLFNYMDSVVQQPAGPFFQCNARYHGLIKTISNEKSAREAPRRHPITFKDVFFPGSDIKNMLPSEVKPGNVSDFRIFTGHIAPDSTVGLIIGLDPERGTDPEELTLYVSRRKCAFESKCLQPENARDGLEYYRFTVPNDGNLPKAQLVEAEIASGSARIVWLEITVK